MAQASYGNHSGNDGGTPGKAGARKPERKDEGGMPAPGPHGEKALTNPDATPGAGALPPVGAEDGTDSTSG